ncbi:MAG: DUF1059 domain-containing protein [Gemmatimonadales bacterium]
MSGLAPCAHRGIGVRSCAVRAETEEEVLRQAAEHAGTTHGLTNLDADTVQKIRSKIRTD